MKHGKATFNQRMVKRQVSGKRAKVMAWDAFSLFIRNRDKWKCYCGREKPGEIMQACHVIPGRHNAMLFCEEGCFCGHSGCNKLHCHQPQIMREWFRGKYGQDALDALEQKNKLNVKYNTGELLTLASYYTQRTAEILKEET